MRRFTIYLAATLTMASITYGSDVSEEPADVMNRMLSGIISRVERNVKYPDTDEDGEIDQQRLRKAKNKLALLKHIRESSDQELKRLYLIQLYNEGLPFFELMKDKKGLADIQAILAYLRGLAKDRTESADKGETEEREAPNK